MAAAAASAWPARSITRPDSRTPIRRGCGTTTPTPGRGRGRICCCSSARPAGTSPRSPATAERSRASGARDVGGPSDGARTMRGMRGTGAGAILVAGLLFSTALGQEASLPQGFEVVVTGVPRPVQLAIDRRTLVVLSPSAQGDSAGEIHRVELDEVFPVDVSRRPRGRIPFADAQLATLGSMALEPTTRDLFLGEENGKRVYRLDADERLSLYLDGLRRVPGGSALVFDDAGPLVLLDHADPLISPAEERTPQALEQFRDEDYRGPLLFRLSLDPTNPLPRRLDRMSPWFPRGWGGRGGGA